MIIESKLIKHNDSEILIRSAVSKDVDSLARHRTITSGETYFMARYPEECNYDMDRMKFILDEIEKSPREFMVTAFIGDEVIGDLGVTQVRNSFKYQHRAYMGMSIQEEYCNAGLGSLMLEMAINQAKENGFEQLELGVFEDNKRAIHLYEKYGFQQYGVQPRAFKLKDGTYRDELIMVRML